MTISEANADINIRLLAGEVWSEMQRHALSGTINIDSRSSGRVIDVLMLVLARHEGRTLKNDPGLPVSKVERFDLTKFIAALPNVSLEARLRRLPSSFNTTIYQGSMLSENTQPDSNETMEGRT